LDSVGNRGGADRRADDPDAGDGSPRIAHVRRRQPHVCRLHDVAQQRLRTEPGAPTVRKAPGDGAVAGAGSVGAGAERPRLQNRGVFGRAGLAGAERRRSEPIGFRDAGGGQPAVRGAFAGGFSRGAGIVRGLGGDFRADAGCARSEHSGAFGTGDDGHRRLAVFSGKYVVFLSVCEAPDGAAVGGGRRGGGLPTGDEAFGSDAGANPGAADRARDRSGGEGNAGAGGAAPRGSVLRDFSDWRAGFVELLRFSLRRAARGTDDEHDAGGLCGTTWAAHFLAHQSCGAVAPAAGVLPDRPGGRRADGAVLSDIHIWAEHRTRRVVVFPVGDRDQDDAGTAGVGGPGDVCGSDPETEMGTRSGFSVNSGAVLSGRGDGIGDEYRSAALVAVLRVLVRAGRRRSGGARGIEPQVVRRLLPAAGGARGIVARGVPE